MMKPSPILVVQRQVEPELLADCRVLLRRGTRTQKGVRRVARGERDKQETQCRYNNQQRDRHQQASRYDRDDRMVSQRGPHVFGQPPFPDGANQPVGGVGCYITPGTNREGQRFPPSR